MQVSACGLSLSYDDTAPKLMRLSPQPAVIGTPRAEAQAFLDSYFDARR